MSVPPLVVFLTGNVPIDFAKVQSDVVNSFPSVLDPGEIPEIRGVNR
jgi:hypothetical protein